VKKYETKIYRYVYGLGKQDCTVKPCSTITSRSSHCKR
jgi:hypothetical protein